MSDLESVDLSRDSDSETVEDTPTKEASPALPPAPPKKSSMPSTPQRTPQRNASARLATPSTQNGTISPRRRLKERKDITPPAAPAPKPPAVSEATTAPSKTVSAKASEPIPSGGSDPVPNAPPPKAKRGRPKKNKTPAKSDSASTARPQATSKPAATAKTAVTATPDSPATQNNAPKTATKPDDGEAPRPSARGRKRQLLTKPAETTNADKTEEKTVAPGTSSSQEPPATQNACPAQKRAAKAAERKLHGAAAKAKASASKRRREEEVQTVTLVAKNGPSRGSKKDGEVPSPEVSEVPPSPVKKGRPTKRLKQQAARQVPREVIRIEDDDTSPERNATGTPPKDKAKNEDQATSTATEQKGEKSSKATAASTRGRQSLPASHKQTAQRRRKTRDLTSGGSNSRRGGPSQDDADEADDGVPKSQAASAQKPKESARDHVQLQKSRVVRHSTGNIVPMEIDANEQSNPDTTDANGSVSNKEALESMLDEIQRNAIPFLLKQDKICDSFSVRMEKDVDGILNNTASDVFQVFSDQVKGALVADRLRLAVASAKTELRRGIEKLLREFARKVGAPMSDENASLLLRNEAFRSSRRFKEERRLSKPFAITSPRISKLASSRRLTEENHVPSKTPHLDYMSDDADRHATTPRNQKVPLGGDFPLLSNAADMKKFVEHSYENLDLNCYRALTILKLCARPGGMTMTGLHEVTPLGLQMIRNKVRDLVDRGYLVEDIIRDGGAIATVYSTAAHVSEA